MNLKAMKLSFSLIVATISASLLNSQETVTFDLAYPEEDSIWFQFAVGVAFTLCVITYCKLCVWWIRLPETTWGRKWFRFWWPSAMGLLMAAVFLSGFESHGILFSCVFLMNLPGVVLPALAVFGIAIVGAEPANTYPMVWFWPLYWLSSYKFIRLAERATQAKDPISLLGSPLASDNSNQPKPS
jgi:hypothetical protein